MPRDCTAQGLLGGMNSPVWVPDPIQTHMFLDAFDTQLADPLEAWVDVNLTEEAVETTALIVTDVVEDIAIASVPELALPVILLAGLIGAQGWLSKQASKGRRGKQPPVVKPVLQTPAVPLAAHPVNAWAAPSLDSAALFVEPEHPRFLQPRTRRRRRRSVR